MLMMLVSHIKYLCMHCERNTCQITINIFSGSSSSDPPPKSDIFSPINLHRLCPCSSTGRYICARIGVSFVIGNDHHHHYSVYKCDLQRSQNHQQQNPPHPHHKVTGLASGDHQLLLHWLRSLHPDRLAAVIRCVYVYRQCVFSVLNRCAYV